MGLRRIEEKMAREAALRKQGADYALKELEDMISNIKNLHERLKQLEKEHGKKMKSSPELAGKLMDIREELGLPRAIGAFSEKEKPGLIDKLTSGGFYDQLSLQILDLGQKKAKHTGGSVSLPDLIHEVQKLYSGYVVTIPEIQKALTVLEKNKLIIGLETATNGITNVIFTEPTTDLERVLSLATQYNGELSRERVILETMWGLERVQRALDTLEAKGIAEKDEGLEGVYYYFPGI